MDMDISSILQMTGTDLSSVIGNAYSSGTTTSNFSDILSMLSGTGQTSQEEMLLNALYGTNGSTDLFSSSELYGLFSQGAQSTLGLETYLQLLNGQSTNSEQLSDEMLIDLSASIQELMQEIEGAGKADDLKLKELMALLKDAQKRLNEIGDFNGSQLAYQQLIALLKQVDSPLASAIDMGASSATIANGFLNADDEQLLAYVYENSAQMLANSVNTQKQGTAQLNVPKQGEVQVNAAESIDGKDAKSDAVQQSGQSEQDNIQKLQVKPEHNWTSTKSLEDIYENSVMKSSAQGYTAQQSQESAAQSKNFAEAEFSANVYKAKESMAQETSEAVQEKPSTGEEESRVIHAGTQVQQSDFAAQLQEVKESPRAAQVPVVQQVETGIVKGIGEGKQEFSIKLYPEGLGEITVKLEKSQENTVLKLIAKNDETKEILAAQLDTLKESLKPLKVDVDNVYTERQFDMLSQQSSQGQGFNEGWRPGANGGENQGSYDELEDGEDEDGAAVKLGAYVENPNLDTKV